MYLSSGSSFFISCIKDHLYFSFKLLERVNKPLGLFFSPIYILIVVAEKGFEPGKSCSFKIGCGVDDFQSVAGKLSLVKVEGYTELDQISSKLRVLPCKGFHPSLELTISF